MSGPAYCNTCDMCDRTSTLYNPHPSCRECLADCCTECGRDYDAETGRIICPLCVEVKA